LYIKHEKNLYLPTGFNVLLWYFPAADFVFAGERAVI